MSASILSAVKNREEHLLRSYKSWLSCESVNEVVIVDWGSDTPISEILEKSEKLKIVRVNPEHSKYWTFTQSFNIAARVASGDSFIIMNADEIFVEPEEVDRIEPPSKEFYYEGTNWDSERAHGVYFLYIDSSLFWSINGYHEGLVGYGYEDVDLRRRLDKTGTKAKQCNLKIEHIQHKPCHKSRENMLNYGISWAYPWSKDSPLIGVTITGSDELLYCDIKESDRITYEEMLEREGRARALSQMSKQ